MPIEETLAQLENIVKNKIPLSPAGWLDIIGRVVIEMSDDTDKLYALQKQVANEKSGLIQAGASVAKAKTTVEGTDIYEQMQKQKARCHKIEELIRIGKLQSKLKDTEFGAGNLQ